MTCTRALALIRTGDRAGADAHATTCAACRALLRAEGRAIEVARRALAAPVPAPDAARIARAALAARDRPWWETALPVAWRAAIAVNLVAAALLLWGLTRAPAPGAAAPPTGLAAPDDVIAEEVEGALGRALGLAGEEDAR